MNPRKTKPKTSKLSQVHRSQKALLRAFKHLTDEVGILRRYVLEMRYPGAVRLNGPYGLSDMALYRPMDPPLGLGPDLIAVGPDGKEHYANVKQPPYNPFPDLRAYSQTDSIDSVQPPLK